MSPELRPPRGGTPPPATATVADGTVLELRPLAQAICERYRREFPDETSRYGDAGVEWCIHDNQHILSWAALEAGGNDGLLDKQLAWLARVLAARDFPLDRLRRNLELAADVVRDAHPEAPALAEALAQASESVRA